MTDHRPRGSRSLAILLIATLQACTSTPFSSTKSDEQVQKVAEFTQNAETYLAGQRLDQAENQIQQGLALDPEHYYLNLYQGWARLLRAGQDPNLFPLAIESLEKARDLRSANDQDYRSYLFLGQAYQGLAQAHGKEAMFLETRRTEPGVSPEEVAEFDKKATAQREAAAEFFAKARSSYQQLLETGESDLQAHRFLFQVSMLESQGKDGDARDEHLRAAAQHGEDFVTKVSDRRKHYDDQTVRALDISVEAESKRRRDEYRRREQDGRQLLAGAYERLGDLDKAIAHLDAWLEISERHPAALYQRGRLYALQGKKAKARDDLEQFMRLTRLPYESPQVERARELLRSLQGS